MKIYEYYGELQGDTDEYAFIPGFSYNWRLSAVYEFPSSSYAPEYLVDSGGISTPSTLRLAILLVGGV